VAHSFDPSVCTRRNLEPGRRHDGDTHRTNSTTLQTGT
jgi:hypothetical protein